MSDRFSLSTEEIQSFNDNGFIGPFDLYDPADAPRLWNKAKVEMVVSPKKPHNSTVINYDRHLDCNTLSDHISRPEIVGRLRALIGDDILCWKTNIFKKDPGDTGTGWHQVEAFVVGDTTTTQTPSLKYTERSDNITQELTVWTAFSDAQKENGCLQFIPGSHKKWYYDESKSMTLDFESKKHDFFGYDYNELKIDPSWDPNQEERFEMEMKPGQFVIFLAKCIHGSLPNNSDKTRLGFASRYVAPSVKIYENVDSLSEFGDTISLDYHGCVLVSGEDKYGYNRIHNTNLNGHPFSKLDAGAEL
ncbi:chlorinating enzymes [Mycobacteroides abscessus subsp. bolletii]|uniref:chlorinating enzyme n=1 Tax=Mycobacteroides abscessus TaxID=36809 RepID=UPI000928BA02|nr:chlorinating enzyme [Mycobacteroides abscessus]SIK04265.1 chlorinating enzymes [Mycobacteroides abscessus subsp. bolletii]